MKAGACFAGEWTSTAVIQWALATCRVSSLERRSWRNRQQKVLQSHHWQVEGSSLSATGQEPNSSLNPSCARWHQAQGWYSGRAILDYGKESAWRTVGEKQNKRTQWHQRTLKVSPGRVWAFINRSTFTALIWFWCLQQAWNIPGESSTMNLTLQGVLKGTNIAGLRLLSLERPVYKVEHWLGLGSWILGGLPPLPEPLILTLCD